PATYTLSLHDALPISTIRTMWLPAQSVACKTWGNNQTTRESYSSHFAWNTSVANFLDGRSCILYDFRRSLALPSTTALISTPERVVYLRRAKLECRGFSFKP